MSGALLKEDTGWILKMNPIEHLDIASYLAEASLQLSAEQMEKLQRFHRMLRQENERINVTRLYSAQSMGRKHYVDSLYPLHLLHQAGLELKGPCMDLGSGGGFPGIPLAIARPDLSFRLVEGRRKRTDFLSEVVTTLGLSNVEVIPRKLNPADRIECNTALSRAFMSIPETLKICARSLNDGGLFLFWKGPDCDSEIQAMQSSMDWNHLQTLEYTLPGGEDRRRLVIFQRLGGSVGRQGQNHASAEVLLADRFGLSGALSHRIQVIESDTNRRYKEWQKLDQSRWIRKTGLTLVAGRKLVPEILEHFASPAREGAPKAESGQGRQQSEFIGYNGAPEALIFDEMPAELMSLVETLELPLIRLKSDLFRNLDQHGTHFPIIVWKLDYVDFPELAASSHPAGSPRAGTNGANSLIVLPLSLPDNLGAAIRTAAGFGIQEVALCKESVYAYHPSVIRSSAGACLRMDFRNAGPLADLNSALQNAGYPESCRVLLDHRAARNITELSLALPEDKPVCFVLGQEGPGLPAGLGGQRFRIPLQEGLESLNAVASLSVLLYEWKRGEFTS